MSRSRGARCAILPILAIVFVYSGHADPGAASRTSPPLRAAAQYPLEALGPPHALTVADVNADGHLDVLTAICDADPDCGTVILLLGNGDGTFRRGPSVVSGGKDASALAVADVTGDRRADVVVTNFGSDTVGVLAGRGDGSFDSAVTYPTTTDASGAAGPDAVAVRDVDGDHLPDLVIAHGQASMDAARDVSGV